MRMEMMAMTTNSSMSVKALCALECVDLRGMVGIGLVIRSIACRRCMKIDFGLN